MSQNFPVNDTSNPNDRSIPYDPNDPANPYGVSRAMPTPTTPADFAVDPPTTPLPHANPTLTPPPSSYPAPPYGAPMLASGAGASGPQGPGGGAGGPTRPRGRGWRSRTLIGVVALVAILALGGGAALAGVALAHGAPTTHGAATSTVTTTTTPAPAHQAPVYTVTSVSANTIAATNANGSPVAITISAQTVYIRADQPASLSDITTGTKIRVLGHQKADGSIVARRIMIVVPTTRGKVTAINGNTITLQTKHGTVTITITSSTKFGKGQTLGVIHVGDVIVVAGVKNSDGTYTALAILDRTAAGTATATPAA